MKFYGDGVKTYFQNKNEKVIYITLDYPLKGIFLCQNEKITKEYRCLVEIKFRITNICCIIIK